MLSSDSFSDSEEESGSQSNVAINAQSETAPSIHEEAQRLSTTRMIAALLWISTAIAALVLVVYHRFKNQNVCPSIPLTAWIVLLHCLTYIMQSTMKHSLRQIYALCEHRPRLRKLFAVLYTFATPLQLVSMAFGAWFLTTACSGNRS